MEDSDDEDNVQVIVFGNSTEANFDDFYKEQDPTKEEHGGDGRGDPEGGEFARGEAEEIPRDVDLDTQVERATRENKVFLKYDYTREKPWAHHADKSMWFNYNFDEHSFKEWVQKHIDKRIEKQHNYQVENADNIFEDKLRAVSRTPRNFEDTYRRGYGDHHEQNYDDDPMRRNPKGVRNNTAMKSSNTRKGALSNNYNPQRSNNTPFQPQEENTVHFQPLSEEDNYMDGRSRKMPLEKASNRTVEGGHPVQGEDLTQFQDLVNFFKLNPGV
ncbi:conserved Plasmodium protein, unknown function [Plasmodium knowlesi strain H]|uniref:Pre-mRNA polyadenylation factor Fip1 domain-containing protein n=3 Tax=Plasmodium knowlesi TaxID=5850 RepID=A0A5K1ULH4_PLAKH|nr:conserved Plasmodium protein, unknown function [Plasmodium knowlesi strain H]XP_038970102.1 conserved Plasmodium protein, unknown function [Plasmodium knowlesi strain H]OTN67532.1 Uncharacterized protein PKNOH_S06434700 [Plasmodium knowlesi]CAA9987617.1 conserved Plasmodium protein, unknown function [Plasmodium knowlesi strain H]CAA9991370.1 conserved Plasmodium protein, unknown function [Plasmodium knowlesi strain H]SBO26983.1 conserved Plasmodium protein, unknown function [Plasmodium know|eukprot:XP_002258617.1 hypothetical protein, conserved in Plasmodium species [Plasmodium knowlesi strain H]